MMVSVNSYMYDGTNWQAQAVLAYVRSFAYTIKYIYDDYEELREYDKDVVNGLCKDLDIVVGRYENCREQGYTFGLCFEYINQINVSVFEHRNSDALCLNVFEGVYTDSPSVDAVWQGKETKYDYDYGFNWGEIVECGYKIIDIFKEFAKKMILEQLKNK